MDVLFVDTLQHAVSRNQLCQCRFKKAADTVTPLGREECMCSEWLAKRPSHQLTSRHYQHADLTSHGHCLICFGSDCEVHYRGKDMKAHEQRTTGKNRGKLFSRLHGK